MFNIRKGVTRLFLALITIIICFQFSVFSFQSIFAQTQTPTPTPSSSQNNSDLINKIHDLENKISDLKSQADSLSSQIDVFDNQIKLTEFRIESTKQQVNDLTLDIDSATKRVKNLESSLSDVSKILINRIVTTYEVGGIQPIHVLASSNDISSLISRANYLKIVQDHDKRLMYNAQQAKTDYANQKNIFEDKKKKIEALKSQLEDYNKQLDTQKDSKQKLLAETQGSEENYQAILAATKAQLAGFSNFTASQGGASLLSGQTTCDDWGCYYNQRDTQWGGNSLNGTQYTLASDGCLVTSMAMVYTHYGHKDVTPQSINSVSSNFSGIPPALLKFSISANGTSSSRSSTDIDSTLASGNPVVVGISYDGGSYPDHFVVFVSGSGGNYTMNDPFTPNGHNISFRGRYPSVRMVQYYRVSI
ncbi:MAG TPA: C39 family peptidase [Candidatus Saccharimonadales bacterium]|nr:C39 family peptidase [Candidatus Saccharimonadales bacterium]